MITISEIEFKNYAVLNNLFAKVYESFCCLL